MLEKPKIQVCQEHKPIWINRGCITGGKSYKQARRANLWIVLDEWTLPDFVSLWDSAGKLTQEIRHNRIVYFPIEDRNVPKDLKTLDKVLNLMYTYIQRNKKVHVSCIGGHGRTGTVLGCFLGKYLDIKDPVSFLRKKYCNKAVETFQQHCSVNEYAGIEAPDSAEYLKATVFQYDVLDPWSPFYKRFILDDIRNSTQKGGENKYLAEEVYYD